MKKLAAAFRAWWGRQGRWTRRGVRALAGLVALWVVAWAAVPPLLKWQLEKQASDILGRAVTVERVRFSPWSLELELQGLRIAAQDAEAEPQVEIARLYVDAELQSMLRLAPVIDAIQVDQPRVRVRHVGEGRYDFDDVLQRLADRPRSESDEPVRFALYNLRLTGGAVAFDDQPVGAVHRLERLELAIPFLSNLGSQREVVTQPHLAFELNGSRFDSQAETTPFAETRATEAQLALNDLDLAPYLGYWPASLPVKPATGRLQARLRVDFEQQGDRPTVKLGGEVTLENFRLQQGSADLLAWERLSVKLADVRPLERHISLERVDWQAPRVWLGRAADGQTNIERLLAKLPRGAAGEPGKAAPAEAPSAPGWTVAVGEFHLKAGRVDWSDQALKPAFATAVEDLDLRVREITWPVKAPMPLNLALRHQGGTLQAEGRATDREAEAALELKGLALADATPYLREVLTQPVKGELAARARLGWRAGEGPDAGPRVHLDELTLVDLQLGSGKELPAALRQLRVAEAELQLNARRLNLGKVLLDRPQVLASRDPQGRWMVQQWLRAPAGAAATPADTRPPPGAAPPEWALGWSSVDIKDGSVRLEDRLTARPVRMTLGSLQFSAGAWQSDAAGRTPLSLDVRVAGSSRSRADPGRLQVQGQLGWKPGTPQPDVTASARVTATALPVHALEPYASEYLNLELLRADAGYRGQVEAGWTAVGLRLAASGDLVVDEFRANTLSPSEELLAWKALNLRGLQLALAPGQPLRLQVAETALTDWYARIAIDATGRINLQDLLKPAPGAPGAPVAAAPAAAPAAPPAATVATAAAPNAPAAPATAAGPAPDLRFGPMALVNGRVLFSDQFIKPNYRANLSELTGKLSAFSNQPGAGGAVELADLELLGRVEGTATLDLRGRINPLAQPLALDVTGKVRDLELPPLSPYSAKYAGYGIERGKLSVNVAYRITPDGQLTASNQIILNQLAFGERVEGSDAPNLPVKLAVALLADRNGVIDINLPISGSMNDPQFSIGPVIVRAVFNLIGKALTAPFALLASALGGGGEDSAQVSFAPGSARLDAEARSRLDGVAKALTDRPALRLTVVGHSDLETERQAYQRERVAELVRAEKRRALTRTGAAADGEITVSAEEYPSLLRAVYRRADITKPRNVIGMAKDIPPSEMEALLMTSVPVTGDAMRELALQRGVAVRDYLVSRQLSTERVFMGAPQGAGQGGEQKAEGAKAAGPRADLQLSTR